MFNRNTDRFLNVRAAFISAISLLLILVLFLGGCATETSYKPTYRTLTEAVYASGLLKPDRELDLVPAVAGRLTVLNVQEGDTVAAGQVLATFRAESPKASLQALQQEVKQALANADPQGAYLRALEMEWRNASEKARSDSVELRRIERLFAKGAATARQQEIARTTFDLSAGVAQGARLRYESQRSQLEAAYLSLKNQLLALRSNVEDFTLRSPIPGRILRVYHKAGDWVSPPTSVLKLASLGPMRAEIQIDEADAIRMRTGLKVLLRVEGHTAKPLTGVVSWIDPAVDPITRTLKVEVTPDKPLYFAGLSLEANIIVQEHGQVLAIPRAYLLPGDSLIVECGRGRERVAVTTGVRDLSYVQIRSGIDTTCRLFLPQ